MIITTFRVGEDIAVGNIVPADIVPEIATMRAFMARSTNPVQFVRPGTGTPTELTVAPRAAEGEIGPGWNFTLTAAQSAMLAEGLWGIDWLATFEDGTTDISEQTLLIRITRSAAA
jgi:hypothetical protein